jgi:chitin disaccharide deacetylase
LTKRLVVNADDYGLTPGTSTGIRQAHLHGIVTSTTAMMNRPDVEPALEEALETCPRLGLGVHLVLTAGKPLLPAENIPDLVDGNGNFRQLNALVSGLPALDLTQVEAEWTAQIAKFRAVTGQNPDHLDAHHHVAYFTPELFSLFTKLANQLGCAIRKPFDGSTEDATVYLPPALQPLATQGYLRIPDKQIPRTTDRFIGNFYGEGASLDHLLATLQHIAQAQDAETYELMCHPALPDEALKKISDYNEKRGEELGMLTAKQVKNALTEAKIELISFGQL